MKFSIEWHAELSSTNAVLLERAGDPNFHGLVLAAHRQTAGRGRLEREWRSHEGNLAFSLGVCLPAAAQHLAAHLPLAMGAAAYDAVAAMLAPSERQNLALKWPNDLHWREQKILGMLSQARTGGEKIYFVLGLGLNVLWSPADLPAQNLAALPLLPQARTRLTKERMLEQILERLSELETILKDPRAIRAAWEARAPYLGKEIFYGTIGSTAKMRPAIAIGLSRDCGLRVRHADGQEVVLVAEDISLRWSTRPEA